jgi:hypothetical protein
MGTYVDSIEQNQSISTKMVLTKFQKRAIKIKQMNDAAEAEAKQLEEDGFCPCSVQKP